MIKTATVFNDIASSDNPNKVVVFTAPSWCVPCKRLEPHLEAAADVLEEFDIFVVDPADAPELAKLYGAMSVPSIYRMDGPVSVPVKARTALTLVKEIRNA